MIKFLKKLFGGGPDLKALHARNALIVDVRTPAEFKGGHPDGAINIPLNKLSGRLKSIQKKGVPVITCCASGRRSGMAARQLTGAGVEAYNGGPWQRVQRSLQ